MGIRPKVVSSMPGYRSLAPWVGGSILASMGTFPDLWVGKSEWEEEGDGVLDRKCP